MSKYLIWHNNIIAKARVRKPLGGYSEVHHIEPRSLGGTNRVSNLVALTYREHFLIHWLLTKIKSGSELRRMQRALFAMTLRIGSREVQPWQLAVARQYIRDLEVDPETEALWLERFREAEAERAKARKYRLADRNGSRAKQRRENLVVSHDAIKSGAKLDRRELNRLAHSVLYPGR